MSSEPRSAVVRYLHRHNLWIKKKDAASVKLTHTFMDGRHGGKVVVPPMHAEPFRDAVAEDVEHGVLPPLNELKYDPIFHFFCDLDIKLPVSAELPDPCATGAVIVKTVKRFLGTWDALRVVVLSAPDKPSGDGKVKRGMHLHFPELRVGMDESLLMREACVDALGKALPGVDWADAFDNAPYVNPCGGLRVVGAAKAQECTYCLNKLPERRTCCQCEQRGKTESVPPQRYGLVACLDADGVVDASRTAFLKANVPALVRATSVRATTQSVVAEWKRFAGCPSYSAPKLAGNRPPAAGSRKREFDEDKKSMRSWPQTQVVDREKIKRLERIFRTRFKFEGDAMYREVELFPVKYSARNHTYYCQFRGAGESFCFNVGRDHKSNRVYGVVNKTSASVRCHCNCATLEGRRGVQCRLFKKEETLSPNDRAVLFADAGGEQAAKRSKGAQVSGPDMFVNFDDWVRHQQDVLYAEEQQQQQQQQH